MGLLDTLKTIVAIILGFLESIGRFILKGADNLARRQKYREEVYRLKLLLLHRFPMKQLEKLAIMYNVPLKVVVGYDPLTGRREIRKLKTKDAVVRRIAESVYYTDILYAARRFKIKYSDIEKMREDTEKRLFNNLEKDHVDVTVSEENHIINLQDYSESTDTNNQTTTMDEILRCLSDFHPRPIRDESHLRDQILQFLQGKLGPERVSEEIIIAGGRQDIVIDGQVVIEIKVATTSAELDRLIGQVEKYMDHGISNIIVLLLDIGKKVNVSYYVSKLKSKGVLVVRLSGQKVSKGRSKKIVIQI